MNISLDFTDLFKIILPLSIIIGAIITGSIKLFYQTEIDRILTTKQGKKKDEMIGGWVVALLFSLITGIGFIVHIPFYQNSMIPLPFGKEFHLVFLPMFLFLFGCFLFMVLLIIGAFPSIRKMSVFKKQIMILLAKITYFLIFPFALWLAFSIPLNVAGLSLASILLGFTILTVFYALILIYLAYLANVCSHSRLKYCVRTIHPSKINEQLEKLYFVYTLNKESFVLSEKRNADEYNLFTPIYVYNHTSNTLTIIEEVRSEVNTEKSRLKTYARKHFFIR